MFSKKKEERPKRNHSGNLSQYGLFDVPTDLSFDKEDGDDLGGDSDLEAELLALTNSGKPKRPARKKVAPNVNLDAMVAASMHEIGSDEELSGDDDDPDLLNELSEITGGGEEEEAPSETSSPVKEAPPGDIAKLLEERLKMYETAEANAKAAGESTRARRFNRGSKTLKDLIKQAKNGKLINNEDIPPEVSVNVRKPAEDNNTTSPSAEAPPPVPVRRAPNIPSPPKVSPVEEPQPKLEPIPEPEPQEPVTLSPENKELLTLLNTRKEEYKLAALKARKSGDNQTAIGYIKIAKQFESVITAVENGQPVDLSRMPGPPSEPSPPQIEENVSQGHSDPTPETVAAETPDEPQPDLIQAGSVLEALQQRLDLYKKQEEAAKEQNNSSKARRMGRIVKQFEQAIKAHNAGKPVAFDELPAPPGFAPIPGTEPPKPVDVGKLLDPTEPPEDSGQPSTSQDPPAVPPRKPPMISNADGSNSIRTSGNHIPTTRMEKQVAILVARQKEFREAALSAKKKGEMAEAKEFLRNAKGFDPLIDAAMGGMPVDMATLPLPPSAKSKLDVDFDLVMKEECEEGDNADIDIMQRLEKQLTKQLKMCLSTRDHHKNLGDVAGMNRFERLALTVTKDLDLIRLAKRTTGAAVPKFHYENKDFSIVKSYTDLNDNDLELTIFRGINYNCANPKDIDTYVKYEFPFPQEEPVKDKTATSKDSNNPNYNTTVILPIQRSARNCLRVFKRHAIKFEVYSKGGFFRSDTLLGTVNVKLQPLETQCEIHDSFDLLDGRKKVGGKLEVRLRIRDPLLTRQIEQLHEKWLVLDH